MKNVNRNPVTGRFESKKNSKALHVKATAPSKKIKHTKAKIAKESGEAATGKTFEILSAMYGIEGNRIKINPTIGKKLNNRMAGSDPAPGVKKDAVIEVNINGELVTRTFAEGQLIEF